MKLAFAVESYLPRLGGTEIRVHELIERLPKSWSIDLYAPKFDDFPVEEQESDNIHIYRLGNFRSSSYFLPSNRPIIPSVRYGMALREAVKRNGRYDAIVFSEWNLMHFRLSHGMNGAKEIVDWCEVLSNNRDNIFSWAKQFGESYLERYMSVNADRHIAVNERIRFLLGREHRVHTNSIDVVPNGISDDMLLNEFPDKSRGSILFVGRLTRHKQVDKLIMAVRQLRNLDIELNIVGAGNADDYERELKELSGCDKRIHFLGTVDKRDLQELYRDAWLLALPSEREGSGMVSLEAMGSFTPTLTVDAPLNQAQYDMVKDGYNGFIVQNSIDGLVDGIWRFYEMDYSSYEKMARNAYEEAKNRTWDRSSKKLERTILETVEA